MKIGEAKRQRRLIRIFKRLQYEKRLRIPKLRIPTSESPVEVNWWVRLIRYIKSFLNESNSTK